MFRVGVQSPQVMLWQARLSRMPRWGWTLIGIIGILVVVPIVLVAVTAGIVVLAVAAGIFVVRNVLRRITGGKQTGLVRQEPFTARDVIVVERIDRPAKSCS